MEVDLEKQGASGLAINSFVAINISSVIYFTNDGSVWLRTGSVETDIASYPDANRSTVTIENVPTEVVGMEIPKVDPDSGFAMYVRIK